MLIQYKTGNLKSSNVDKGKIDCLELDWYETTKRILRKRTRAGKEVSLKFLNENPALTEGDILYEDEQTVIAVTILSCDAIVVKPANMFELASVCYEIGNRHLPLFHENDDLLVPFEIPLFRLLELQGYDVRREERKLLEPLKTTVSPHAQLTGESLFSKIMKQTATDE
ncbi:MAG: urease accessory protein UreE [Chitinophagaceae bacterium]